MTLLVLSMMLAFWRTTTAGRCVYTLTLRGGSPANHTTGAPRLLGRRYDTGANQLLSHVDLSGSRDPLRDCEAQCTSDGRCVGLSLLNGADCYTVNATKPVATWVSGVSYLCQLPPTAPAPIRYPLRGWSVSCDLPSPRGGMELYPGVNLLTEGAPPTAMASLARAGVGVLAYRDLEQPFRVRSGHNPSACRTDNYTDCIDAVADMFRAEDRDAQGTTLQRWSGIALDEWTTGNRSNWPTSTPWGAPHALEKLAAGCREGRRRYPDTFAAGWISAPDDTFADLMRDGTLDLAMVEGYSVCWLPNHCSPTIEGYFSRLNWARRAGFINRTVFAFGWMVPEDATGPFTPPLNATHPNIPERCDHNGCDNPHGWTMPRLRAAMMQLKAAFPEMPGVLAWGGDCGGCGEASRTFIRNASKLMEELWPAVPSVV
jgi:bacterioferritin-associated ferredoxin